MPAETFTEDLIAHLRADKAEAAIRIDRVEVFRLHASQFTTSNKSAALAEITSGHAGCAICAAYEGNSRLV
jgi:hypothetical protein